MIDGVEFSDRGDTPTGFEVQLVETASALNHWVLIGRRLMTELGATAGLQALCVLLDELGGEKIHIPQRRHLFKSLWTRQRDEVIRSILSQPNPPWTITELAEHFGVSRPYCSRLGPGKPERTTGHDTP